MIKQQLSNIISFFRVIWAIVFYVLITEFPLVNVHILLIFFVLIETSDFLDGMTARLCNITSNVGKLLDPVCDITAHFLCLFALHTLYMVPTIVLIIFMIREIWVTFLRTILMSKGIVFASRWSGKLKTGMYAVAIFTSILLLPQSSLVNNAPHVSTHLLRYLPFLYYAGVILSIFSALTYVFATLRLTYKKQSKMQTPK